MRRLLQSVFSGDSASTTSSLSGTGPAGRLAGPGNGLLGLGWQLHHAQLQPGDRLYQDLQHFPADRLPLRLFQIQPADREARWWHSDVPISASRTRTRWDPKTEGLGAFLLGPDPISGQGCTQNNGGQGCVISSFGDGLGVARCNCPLTESEQQFQFVNNWTKMKGNHQIQVRRRHPLRHELAHPQRQQPHWRI